MQKASDNNPPLRAGETSEAVRILQMALVDLGFSMPITTKASTTLPDGIFGAETTRTVQLFQQANGLTSDGIAGRETLAVLEALIIAASATQASADALIVRHRTAFS
jgi:peptidoglycan hydrolase-like protein with peptidoglycan-binding domain